MRKLIIIFLYLGCILAAESHHTGSLPVTATTENIKIDGYLKENVWQKAAVLDKFYQFEPQYNEPATFPTIIRAVYNKKMLYISFECKDPQPDRITARETKRDGQVFSDDAVAIALDPFDNNNSAYGFMINPLGTQHDILIADNGKTTDVNWDETWYAQAQINEAGWTAEFGIPFKSIKYDKSLTKWGFIAGRWIARLKENHFLQKDLITTTRVSQFGYLTNLDLQSLAIKKYQIIPYVQGEYQKNDQADYNAGLDLRYNPVSNVGLSFTINPDFATIEGDVEQVNLTRFELSYPEKRPFFLEGAENYSTRISQFYSRRIGEIPWGAKFTGKFTNWSVNGLVTQSDPTTAGKSGVGGTEALYSVFRVNRELKNGSTIGLIGANRRYRKANNGSLGLMSTLFFNDELGVVSQIVKSHGSIQKGTWAYFIRPAYDNQLTHFHVRYSHYGTGVKENINAIGFIRNDDRREIDSNLNHYFWINRFGLDAIRPLINYNQYWSQSGNLRSRELYTKLEIGLYKKFDIYFNYEKDYDAKYKPYFEKDFYNHFWGGGLDFDNKQGVFTGISYKRGKNYDSQLEVVQGELGLKILRGWNFTYQAEKIWLHPGQPGDNSWIHFIRSSYYFNNDLYVKIFYQTRYRIKRFWRDLDYELDRKTFQIRGVWRFLPPFGSLQIAYQEGRIQYTDARSSEQTIFMKLAWVF